MEIVEANEPLILLESNAGLIQTRAGRLAPKTSRQSTDLFRRVALAHRYNLSSDARAEYTDWMDLAIIAATQDVGKMVFPIETLVVTWIKQMTETMTFRTSRENSLKDAAEAGSIAFSTARSYLENIFTSQGAASFIWFACLDQPSWHRTSVNCGTQSQARSALSGLVKEG